MKWQLMEALFWGVPKVLKLIKEFRKIEMLKFVKAAKVLKSIIGFNQSIKTKE